MSHSFRRVIVLAFCVMLLALPLAAGAAGPTPTGYTLIPGGTGTAALSTEQARTGVNSVKLATVTTNDRGMVRFEYASGALKLDDLTALSYWEYVAARDNDLDVFIDIWLDFDANGIADTNDYPGYLQAEPLYTVGAAPLNTWTHIDAMTLKWSTYVGPDDPYNAPTIADLQANTAVSAWTNGVDFGQLDILRVDVRVGYGGTWTNFTGYADDIVINGYFQGFDTPSDVWVDDDWAAALPGSEVAPGQFMGYNAFATIQDGVNAVAGAGTVNVAAGAYHEDVLLNKTVSLLGAGAGNASISGVIGGDTATVRIAANDVTVSGFTITRDGNNTTDWNDPNLNSAGVAVIGQALTGMTIRDNVITGNRTGIDINNSNGHTVRNNVIDFNRTGMILRNQTDNLTVVENDITNNWTTGVVFLDASSGTNSPVQTAANCDISNNNISGNWYGGIVDRQVGGSLPAAGTNLKNFSGNWFGTAAPVVSTANSAEPGYSAQIPVAFGGTAAPPATAQPDILGPASANFDFTPYPGVGTDTNVETTAGRGTNGFQGDFSSLYVTAAGAQSGATGRIEEALGLVKAGGTVNVVAGTYTVLANTDMNKANVTLAGAGSGQTHVQVSGTGYRFSVLAPGVVIRDLDIVKTDKTAEQNIIWINASDVTVKNNAIHGQWVFNDGEVVRAMVISGGNNGLLIEGNTIYGLRQPAYVSGPVTGDVKTNLVYGTKGWVLEGGCLTFTGNTWGTGNVFDIAILSSVPSTCYANIPAMSAANNNAVIEDQRTSPAVLSVVYVDASAPAGGNGGPTQPYNDINSAWTRVAPGGKIIIAGAGVYNVAAGTHPGGIVVNANGVTVNLNGATIGAGSPAFTINADDVVINGPGTLDGNGTDPGILVNSGADNFTLNGVELKNWLDGVQVAGSHASLKLVNNWLHDNGTGFRFNSGVVLTGVVTIEGNLFKFNTGNGIESAVAVKAEYNSWGNIGGPAAGDGASSVVDADPWGFVEVFTDAAITAKNVVENETFVVNAQVAAAGLYAVQYKLTYDPTLLVVQNVANGPFSANCAVNTATAGVITAHCYRLEPAADAAGDPVVVNAITFKAQPDSTHAVQPSWTTHLDLKHDDGLYAGARGGIKVWVDNAGFGAPSSADRDITDDEDGTIIIAGAAQYTGYIDLQGRTNDSGATLNVYDQATIAGSTLKANATSASSGAYTTAYATGHQLAIGTTYYFQVDRDLYLPTTRTYTPAGTSWAHLKELINRPTTTLDNVVLLGGDATNDNLVDISDASCIGDDYSQAPSLCGTTVGSSSDVTGDGKVDILDLTLMGGNYNKTESPWTVSTP